MSEIWTIHNKKMDYASAAKHLNISPVAVKVMRDRGLKTENDMRKFLGMADFTGYDGAYMKDLVKSGSMLLKALQTGCHVRIVGDYDVDGIVSVYILYTGLKRIASGIWNAGNVIDYEIPDRMNDGYGINERIVEDAKRDHVDIILTCDNGIAAVNALALAKSYDMTVIVTDHHGIPDELPPADAIVNPHQADCLYPFKELCGAAVAFKLTEWLFYQNNLGQYIEHYAPYVAMATVCDVMPLMDENRYLVKHGLRILKEKMESHTLKDSDPGLYALLAANEVSPEALDSFTFGFIIGPCLNASGRLHTAKLGLDLLLDDGINAETLAGEVSELNKIRKQLCKKYEESACKAAFSDDYIKDKVIVMLLEECHESIAGIIAGRVREATGKPTLILTRSGSEPDIAKGSGRSIPEYNMFHKLNEVKCLFLGFGGHPMAAGFSLKAENVERLREELNSRCNLTDRDIAIKRKIDVVLPSENVSAKLLSELDQLKPYGAGNEKPVFAMRNVKIVGLKIVGQKQNALQLQIQTETGQRIKGVYFNSNPLGIFRSLEEESGLNIQAIMDKGESFSIPAGIIYFPKENEWNGNLYMDYVITAVKWMG
ncbi:MAG: single-stranded-DNA-specific exonuclease RecJ [Clostridium sp.]|nr:single-stranded-DNA-specific exonuclease RecJ [Clostridium sp.]